MTFFHKYGGDGDEDGSEGTWIGLPGSGGGPEIFCHGDRAPGCAAAGWQTLLLASGCFGLCLLTSVRRWHGMPISADCSCTEARPIMKDPSLTQRSCSGCPPRRSRMFLIAEPDAPPDRGRIPALQYQQLTAAPAGERGVRKAPSPCDVRRTVPGVSRIRAASRTPN